MFRPPKHHVNINEKIKLIFLRGKISSNVKYFLTVCQCFFPMSQSTVASILPLVRDLGSLEVKSYPTLKKDSKLTPSTSISLHVL